MASEKLKVYLDTSVISHLLQEDVPEKMADTRKLWEKFEAGEYEVCLSTLTLGEVDECAEPKRSEMWKYLNRIRYSTFQVTENVLELARKIISLGILTERNFDDCQHLAVAMLNDCDCIVSWNFKHIVRVRTIRGIRAVADLEGCKPMEIWSPSFLIGD